MELTPQLIATHVVLSEFDIDEGASLRTYFSRGAGTELFDVAQHAQEVANNMLPDGAEKFQVGRSVFIVNRPLPSVQQRFFVFQFSLSGDPLAHSPTSAMQDWQRQYVGELRTFVPEVLMVNASTKVLATRFQGEVMLPPRVVDSSCVHVYSSTPEEVTAFLKKFEAHELVQRSELRSATKEEEVPTDKHVSGDVQVSSTSMNAFVVMDDPVNAKRHGFLMRSDDTMALFAALGKATEEANPATPTVASAPGVEEAITVEDAVLPTTCVGETQEDVPTKEPVFALCAVASKTDSSARRGGITKSVAAMGPSLVRLEPFFPILVEAAQAACDITGTDEAAMAAQQEVLQRCYESINKASAAVAVALAASTRLSMEVERYSHVSPGGQSYIFCVDAPFGRTHHAQVPVSSSSHDVQLSKYSLECLVEMLGPQFMHLMLGVATEKRIVFLSAKGTSTDVCEAALALGQLGELFNPSFLAEKVFPYASVNAADQFAGVPGYIIGTVNPIFENESAWHWDMLCDLDQLSITLAGEPNKKQTATQALAANLTSATAGIVNAVGVGDVVPTRPLNTKGLSPQVVDLWRRLTSSIAHMRLLRTTPMERNRRLRLMMEEFLYVHVLIAHVAGSDVEVPVSLRPTFTTPQAVLFRERFQRSSMMDNVRSWVLFEGESPALALACAALRRSADGDLFCAGRILHHLLQLIHSPEDILLFLRRMPLALGGLDPVAMQLMNPSFTTRSAAVRLLTLIESTKMGRVAVASMSSYLVLVYQDSAARIQQRLHEAENAQIGG